MNNPKIEFFFLKSSIEQFLKDLEKLGVMIQKEFLSEEEKIELMSYLVAAKESIEALEMKTPI